MIEIFKISELLVNIYINELVNDLRNKPALIQKNICPTLLR